MTPSWILQRRKKWEYMSNENGHICVAFQDYDIGWSNVSWIADVCGFIKFYVYYKFDSHLPNIKSLLRRTGRERMSERPNLLFSESRKWTTLIINQRHFISESLVYKHCSSPLTSAALPQAADEIATIRNQFEYFKFCNSINFHFPNQ